MRKRTELKDVHAFAMTMPVEQQLFQDVSQTRKREAHVATVAAVNAVLVGPG